jgi:Bifunctional DNA primase/polymerase, N-terminal
MIAAITDGCTDLTAISELRAHLWEAGFRSVPVYGPYATVPNPGKQPKGQAWQEAARQDPPHAAVHLAEPNACNTGILCDGLRAIDINIEASNCVLQICDLAKKVLGAAPIRRRTNSSRCLLLYRAAEGSPKKLVAAGTVGQIEVLGHGHQFVAFGTHASGAELEWTPSAPGKICIHEVTAVREERVATFLREVAPLIGVQPPKSNALNAVSTTAKTAALLDVESALCAIPNDAPKD